MHSSIRRPTAQKLGDDFADGARGKYAKRFAEGTNVVVLDPDVAAQIKSAEEVNRILREHLAAHVKAGPV